MASALKLPPLPTSLKGIAHQIKTASEHETRDPVVTYWCRLSALQVGMKLDKSSKEALGVLLPLMDWLEKEKKVLADNEAVSNEVVASAHIENYAMKLFTWADKEDRNAHFNKNVVKAFYTAGMLFDVMAVFGELTPENAHARKYAKWKAAYIHNCLKSGETPIAGPAAGADDAEFGADNLAGGWQVPVVPSAGQPESNFIPNPGAAAPTPAPVPTPRASVNPPAPAPSAVPVTFDAAELTSGADGGLTPHQISKTKKYCKFVESALDYDDKASAIDSLQKALRLLQTGQE